MDNRIKIMITINPVHHLAIRIRGAKADLPMGEVVEGLVRDNLADELKQASDAMKDRKVKKS